MNRNGALGRAQRDTTLDLFEEYRGKILWRIRNAMVELASRRPGRTVTADDAYEVYERICEQEPEWRRIDARFLGAVFRGKQWVNTGWVQSQRSTNHARYFIRWRYVGGRT